jgi:ribosomal protein S18 acetylase RimI-like enzyme
MEQPRGSIRVVDRTDAAVATQLGQEISAFNMRAVDIHDGRELFAAVRDERGALVAGVDGWTWGATGWIEHLWVRSEDRRRGLGSALLCAVEQEARDRGCAQLGLCTHSFQAPLFYRRHGFEVTGEIPGYPVGHSYFLMRKILD